MTVPIGPAIADNLTVSVDAFTGTEVVSGTFAPTHEVWALTAARVGQAAKPLLPAVVDQAAWSCDQVGWGVVLPEPPGLSPAALATADDAPEPIQELVAARHGKVLRYRTDSGFAAWTLRDYAGHGDLLNAMSPPGVGPKQLPMYVLIYAGPTQIPWQLQYSLNPVRYVGRLDLEGEQLANYVTALIGDWSDSKARYDSPVVWSVDLGGGDTDITTLMRETIAAPVHIRLSQDTDITGTRFIDGAATDATGQALAECLEQNKPYLVVTTSHGMTGPLNDHDAMRANLGMPVDQAGALVHPDRLLTKWQPDGAIWFAQACCSAGADSPSTYQGLFESDSLLDRTLQAVASLGPMTSPLPRELLGAPKPLRAFVGHVEPTFNWTMSFPPNRQVLTSDLEEVLYSRLCLSQPVGLAMSPLYRPVGSLLIDHGRAVGTYDTSVQDAERRALDMALYSKVVAYDRVGTVILGDPTAAIPLPKRP
ncbi:hypothetical protein ABZW30_32675 [Kitasatospora sp. NPDC004669]|uniref:hypothetical protein n=1 Tax=Kitasatospora sp. NPDC004669 TaxID=3154555 RepID=UPI0033B10E9B